MDKLREARENLAATATKMEQLNEAVGANPMTDEQRSEWSELKELRSKQTEVIERLSEMEAVKKDKVSERSVDAFKLEDTKKEVKTAEVKVGESRSETKEAAYANTEILLQGVVSKNDYMVKAAQRSLVEGGHLPTPEQREGGFTTYQDSKGGIFIPTVISDQVYDMEQQYGVIPQLSQMFPIANNRLKIPSVIGRPRFYAVNEKSVIPGSGLNFGGIELDLLKWGCIVDWTNEAGSETGGKILPILMRKMAEASAFLKDDTVFNGDGTSQYHTLKGFVELANDTEAPYVRKTVAATGNTSFTDLTANDFLNLKYEVSPSARMRGVYVMHPDLEKNLLELEDTQGQYIYGGPAGSGMAPTLWGRPLYFSEAAPIADGTNAPAAFYYDPSYLAYGNGPQMGVTRLSEATIVDESGKTVNLATQDASALRFTQFFDFQPSNTTTATNGVDKGAFAVLFTAAS